MKRLVSILLGLGLLVPIVGFAQTDGDKGKKEAKKAPKKGEKSKKGSGSGTTPPPK